MADLPRFLLALDAAATPAGVEQALALGADGILVRSGAVPAETVRRLAARLPVVAVVPNMPQLMRDVAEHGGPRAALARLRPGGVGAWLRLGLTGLTHVRAAAAQDFAGLLPILMALDQAALGAVTLRALVLSAPLTDLLLAAQHRACFAHLVGHVRRRARLAVGFETLNLGHLLPRLAEWGVAPDFVIGPANPAGARMKPGPAAVLDAIRRSATPVIASDVTAGGRVSAAGALAWAVEQGAAGAVVPLADVGGPVRLSAGAP